MGDLLIRIPYRSLKESVHENEQVSALLLEELMLQLNARSFVDIIEKYRFKNNVDFNFQEFDDLLLELYRKSTLKNLGGENVELSRQNFAVLSPRSRFASAPAEAIPPDPIPVRDNQRLSATSETESATHTTENSIIPTETIVISPDETPVTEKTARRKKSKKSKSQRKDNDSVDLNRATKRDVNSSTEQTQQVDVNSSTEQTQHVDVNSSTEQTQKFIVIDGVLHLLKANDKQVAATDEKVEMDTGTCGGSYSSEATATDTSVDRASRGNTKTALQRKPRNLSQTPAASGIDVCKSVSTAIADEPAAKTDNGQTSAESKQNDAPPTKPDRKREKRDESTKQRDIEQKTVSQDEDTRNTTDESRNKASRGRKTKASRKQKLVARSDDEQASAKRKIIESDNNEEEKAADNSRKSKKVKRHHSATSDTPDVNPVVDLNCNEAMEEDTSSIMQKTQTKSDTKISNRKKRASTRKSRAIDQMKTTTTAVEISDKNDRQKRTRRKSCCVCREMFANESKCLRHAASAHANECPYVCYACGYAFRALSTLDKHVADNHWQLVYEHECTICPPKSRRVYAVESHALRHGLDVHRSGAVYTTRIRCHTCPRYFPDAVAAREHAADAHPIERRVPIYACNLCKQRFVDVDELKIHDCGAVVTANPKVYLCDACSWAGLSECECEQHIFAAHGRTCKGCGASYRKKHAYDKHVGSCLARCGIAHDSRLRMVQAQLQTETEDDTASRVGAKRDHVICPLCKASMKMASLRRHLVHHSSNQQPCKCAICSTIFDHVNAAIPHFRHEHPGVPMKIITMEDENEDDDEVNDGKLDSEVAAAEKSSEPQRTLTTPPNETMQTISPSEPHQTKTTLPSETLQTQPATKSTPPSETLQTLPTTKLTPPSETLQTQPATKTTTTGETAQTRPATKTTTTSETAQTRPASKTTTSSETAQTRPARKTTPPSETLQTQPATKTTTTSETAQTRPASKTTTTSETAQTRPARKTTPSSETLQTQPASKTTTTSETVQTPPASKTTPPSEPHQNQVSAKIKMSPPCEPPEARKKSTSSQTSSSSSNSKTRQTSAVAKATLKPSIGKQYRCEVCEKRFTLHRLAQAHKRSHTSSFEAASFKCTLCSRRFVNRDSLILHKHRRHGIARRHFACHLCTASRPSFASWSRLNSHKRRHHLSNRAFACSICERRFASRVLLLTHVAQHTTQRDYWCEACACSFHLKKLYKMHMRMHRKPYPCVRCDRGFTDKTYLRRHLATVHPSSKRCRHCARAFPSLAELKQHFVQCHDYRKCASCDWGVFESRSLLSEHEKSVHSSQSGLENRDKTDHSSSVTSPASNVGENTQLKSTSSAIGKDDSPSKVSLSQNSSSSSSLESSGSATSSKIASPPLGGDSRAKTSTTGTTTRDELQKRIIQKMQALQKRLPPERNKCSVCGMNFQHTYELVRHVSKHAVAEKPVSASNSIEPAAGATVVPDEKLMRKPVVALKRCDSEIVERVAKIPAAKPKILPSEEREKITSEASDDVAESTDHCPTCQRSVESRVELDKHFHADHETTVATKACLSCGRSSQASAGSHGCPTESYKSKRISHSKIVLSKIETTKRNQHKKSHHEKDQEDVAKSKIDKSKSSPEVLSKGEEIVDEMKRKAEPVTSKSSQGKDSMVGEKANSEIKGIGLETKRAAEGKTRLPETEIPPKKQKPRPALISSSRKRLSFEEMLDYDHETIAKSKPLSKRDSKPRASKSTPGLDAAAAAAKNNVGVISEEKSKPSSEVRRSLREEFTPLVKNSESAELKSTGDDDCGDVRVEQSSGEELNSDVTETASTNLREREKSEVPEVSEATEVKVVAPGPVVLEKPVFALKLDENESEERKPGEDANDVVIRNEDRNDGDDDEKMDEDSCEKMDEIAESLQSKIQQQDLAEEIEEKMDELERMKSELLEKLDELEEEQEGICGNDEDDDDMNTEDEVDIGDAIEAVGESVDAMLTADMDCDDNSPFVLKLDSSMNSTPNSDRESTFVLAAAEVSVEAVTADDERCQQSPRCCSSPRPQDSDKFPCGEISPPDLEEKAMPVPRNDFRVKNVLLSDAANTGAISKEEIQHDNSFTIQTDVETEHSGQLDDESSGADYSCEIEHFDGKNLFDSFLESVDPCLNDSDIPMVAGLIGDTENQQNEDPKILSDRDEKDGEIRAEFGHDNNRDTTSAIRGEISDQTTAGPDVDDLSTESVEADKD
ncbi:uncharacterized protein LOC141914188 [Tubulanus polymorphus]|uniref:uncharacterized protein LOC141914188 n=1 Tax=Tubulanus polymorphus TaxID=672921 RepID=UPI003DA29769